MSNIDGSIPLTDPKKEKFCQVYVLTNHLRESMTQADIKLTKENRLTIIKDDYIQERIKYLRKESKETQLDIFSRAKISKETQELYLKAWEVGNLHLCFKILELKTSVAGMRQAVNPTKAMIDDITKRKALQREDVLSELISVSKEYFAGKGKTQAKIIEIQNTISGDTNDESNT